MVVSKYMDDRALPPTTTRAALAPERASRKSPLHEAGKLLRTPQVQPAAEILKVLGRHRFRILNMTSCSRHLS